MLCLSESLIPLIIQRLIIAQVSSSGGRMSEAFRTLKLRFEVATSRAIVDSFIVGGITFFSSMIAIGYGDIMVNIKISLSSSIMLGGLTFFNSLRTLVSNK